MNKLVLFIIFYFLVFNVRGAEAINSNDFVLINSLKIYEIESHIKFQDELYASSDKFIKNQSANFVDNETGFFKLWGEAFSYFDSDTKKEARWKSRLEKHFRTTEYLNFIQSKQEEYSKLINSQRKELLGKLHQNNRQLSISSNYLKSTIVSSQEMNKVIASINKLVLTEVIPEVIESIIIPICLTFLALVFGIVLTNKWIKGFIFIFSIIVSVWLSFKYSNELEQEINERFELKEKQHLLILPQLNKNTKEYYHELIDKINQ